MSSTVQSNRKIALWHRKDLRISDNKALTEAVADGRAYPLFVFDPHFYRSPRVTDARLRFLHESLQDLDNQYKAVGSELALFHGDPVAVLRGLDVDAVYYNRCVTTGYAKERDEKIAELPFAVPHAGDGIVRRGNSRDGWESDTDEYFARTSHPSPRSLPKQTLQGSVTCSDIETRYDVSPEKEVPYEGGTTAGWEQLRGFIDRIRRYPSQISAPADAETGTSRLSPYLKFGCLSIREAMQHAEAVTDAELGCEMFTDRLYWNQNFQQKLADWPKAAEIAINPVMRGLWRDSHDADLVAAWKAGRTGYPLVDASMRSLKQTGWMNFRMRAMTASFYSYILQCHWKAGADHFYRHLIDADPAINYGQWQIQAGLTGKHPMRVYDPMKQVREHDPNGEYIFKYVPELEGIPLGYLPTPWKLPESTQQEAGIRIGEEYPRPVVDFEEQKVKAKAVFDRITDRASEALQDPDVWRRASLSSRHEQPGADEELSVDENQQTFDDISGG